MRTKHCFNMVEILLALGVCAIGVCSIMVLFPVGAAATRDAAMETYAAHAADQMLHYMKYSMQADNAAWKNAITTKLPSANPDYSAFDDLVTNWDSAVTDFPTIFPKTGTAGVYQVISWRGSGTPSLSATTVDQIEFRAIMNVWYETTGLSGVDEYFAVRLNAEVCWPAELPAASRQKTTYSLEVFNPNYLN